MWSHEHEQLIAASMRWAASGGFDAASTIGLRRHVVAANHRHYRRAIPLYRAMADRAGTGDDASFDRLRRTMLLPDGIFKSYPQSLLDRRDFAAMTRWLRSIFHDDIAIEMRGVDTIDDWLATLERAGIHAVYSSGTSGNLSFVPRDEYSWALFRDAPLHYVMLLLARLGVVGRWQAAAARIAGATLGPRPFQRIAERVGLRDFDGIFLNFTGGNQGIQLVGQQLARRVRTATFLYPLPISATALRTLARGSDDPSARAITEQFLAATVRNKAANYDRVIGAARAAIRAGQRVLLFGAPYLVKEFCDRVIASEGRLALAAGSIVGYGGGWKSFDGERLSEASLASLIERATGVRAPFIVEAYSMTEIGALMMKCAHGRFHVPPILETVILDAALEPVDDRDEEAAGILGVMDPFAASYPGLLITGDAVHRSRRPCECGIAGDTLLSVGRAAGAEVKGCGGIMATVNA